MRTIQLTGMAMLCAAALLAAGCRRGGGPGDESAGAKPPETARPAGRQRVDDRSEALKAAADKRAPQGAFAELLGDLASGDMVRAWRAEEHLARLQGDAAPAVRAAFGSSSPEARAAACRLAYGIGGSEFLPALVAALADESRLVRVEANANLCGLTGQDHGFRADALPADRAEAIARWGAWHARTYGPVGGRR